MRSLVLLSLLAGVASAQTPDWSTLTPGAGAVAFVETGLGAPWEAGPGVAARLEAPAYGGRVRADVVAAEYATSDEAVPAFLLVVPTLGWGPSLEAGRVRVGAGGRVGAAAFRIDDDTAGNLQNEIEAAVGAWAGGAVRFGRLEVWAEAAATRVTLSDSVTLVTAAGGLAVRLEAPRWLRGVLR